MPKRNIVSLCLFGLMVSTSYLSWQGLNKFLFSGQTGGNEAVLIALAFLFFAVFLGLAILLFDSAVAMAGLIAGLGVFLLIFGVKTAYIFGVALGLIFMFLAVRRSLSAKRVRLRILSWEILRPSLGFFFTMTAALISLVLYFSPTAQDLDVEIKIPRPLFDFMYGSLNIFLDDQTKNTLYTTGIDLIQPDKQAANNKSDLQLNQQAEDKVYEVVNRQMNYFLRSYKRFLPYGFAVTTFFALKAISLAVVWIALGLIQLIFVSLKNAGLFSIKKEMVEKEVVEI